MVYSSQKLSECIIEIKPINRMGKTRDLFKKIRVTKGTFHAKMGSINGMGLRDAEDIKKRWQEYTEELYKKDLHDPGKYHRLQPTRLLYPWDFPGKSTGVRCHCLLPG